MKGRARKMKGLGVVAAILIATAKPAAAVSSSDINRLQSRIERLQGEVDSLNRRAMRLTSECDGQKCVLGEAVTYDSYGQCKQSIAPEKAEFSLCVPMGDHPSGNVPVSP